MIRSKSIKVWHIALFVIAVCSFFVFLWSPFQGDDLSYKSVFQGAAPIYDSWLKYPRWVARHWVYSNGRMSNYLIPLLLVLPKIAVAFIFTIVISLMYLLSILSLNTRNDWSFILMVILFFLLPWWDSMFIFDCQTNYVWASVGVLAIYLILVGKISLNIFLATLICFIGGMMHEAASASLAAGIIAFMLINRHKPDRYQAQCMVAFFCGAILTVFSPGIIFRAAERLIYDDPLPILLFKSDLVAILLWLGIILIALIPRLRILLKSIFQTPLCILAVGSLIGIIISGFSGIIGRSGWFAELFAMIVLVSLIGTRIKCPRILSYIVLIAITVVSVSCVVYQHRIWKDFEELEKVYSTSDTPIVYLDGVRDTDIPVVLTFNRLRGLPDPDDTYLLYCMAQYYRHDDLCPVILPTEVKKYLTTGFQGEYVQLNNGDRLLKTLPPDSREVSSLRDGLPLMTVVLDGTEWVIKPIDQYYHLSPRIIDPGDRDEVY